MTKRIGEKLGLYTDIGNVQIRTWNRCAMFFRAAQEGGVGEAQHYLQRLDDIGRKQTTNMLESIRDRGYTTVRREVLETHQ